MNTVIAQNERPQVARVGIPLGKEKARVLAEPACEVCNVDLSPKEMKPLIERPRDDLVVVTAGVDVVGPLLAQW